MILNKMPRRKVGINISGATVTISSMSYTGQEISLEDNLAVTYDGVTLTESDYVLSGRVTATNAGTYTAYLKGRGSFVGTKTFTWTVNKANGTPYSVTASWGSTTKTIYNPGSSCKFTGFPVGAATGITITITPGGNVLNYGIFKNSVTVRASVSNQQATTGNSYIRYTCDLTMSASDSSAFFTAWGSPGYICETANYYINTDVKVSAG